MPLQVCVTLTTGDACRPRMPTPSVGERTVQGHENTEGKVGGSPRNCAAEPGKVGSMEAEHEKGRCGEMTFKAMDCSQQERERRIAVCTRLNVLAHKKAHTDDKAKAKRIERNIAVIVRQERPWMKDIAYFLY